VAWIIAVGYAAGPRTIDGSVMDSGVLPGFLPRGRRLGEFFHEYKEDNPDRRFSGGQDHDQRAGQVLAARDVGQ
jgi:hypothetical protein